MFLAIALTYNGYNCLIQILTCPYFKPIIYLKSYMHYVLSVPKTKLVFDGRPLVIHIFLVHESPLSTTCNYYFR
jgi:hypothetical protein